MSFRLVPKWVTLNNLEWRSGRYFRYFSEIGSIWGALCKNGGRYSKTFCDRKVGRSFCFLSIYHLRCYDVGNPSMGGLNARGVAKYSDFGRIEGYISETVRARLEVS